MPRVPEKPALRIGLIGTGFMGKAHVFGYATAEKVFDLPVAPGRWPKSAAMRSPRPNTCSGPSPT